MSDRCEVMVFPCGWCGGPGEVRETVSFTRPQTVMWTVACKNTHPTHMRTPPFPTKAGAIALWNGEGITLAEKLRQEHRNILDILRGFDLAISAVEFHQENEQKDNTTHWNVCTNVIKAIELRRTQYEKLRDQTKEAFEEHTKVAIEPAPTAPREREMSALDQQVAEARQELVDASREQCRCGPGADEPCEACERWMEAYDALLTTRRRQVLQEVAQRIRELRLGVEGHPAAFVNPYPGCADFVESLASLRDTKENV